MRTRSLLRKAQYARLSRLSIDGLIIDIGGSKKSGYHELIGGMHTFDVTNIDESYVVDTLFDAEKTWPYEDRTADAVFFINVLEHLYDAPRALKEARRVLRPGGSIVAVVPFMYNVHGAPSDYFRYTRFALERMLADAGFSEILVEEQGSGVFGVVYQSLLGFVRWHWLAHILEPLFVGVDRLFAKVRPGSGLSEAYFPLGYYVEARA